MTLPFFCMIAAFALNYLSKIPVAVAMVKNGGYNNSLPREQQGRLEGVGKRALAGHLNSFEMTPIFAAAVITAHLFGDTEATIMNAAAIIFVLSRLAYHVLYLANLSTLRSLTWSVGFACVATLFVTAI